MTLPGISLSPQLPGYPVQPEHIDASQYFWDAFGNYESEMSAAWIVRFCQDRRQGWAPFSYADIDDYYRRRWPVQHFVFNDLRSFICGGMPHISAIQGDERQLPHTDARRAVVYTVLHSFVARCFLASPASREATADATAGNSEATK